MWRHFGLLPQSLVQLEERMAERPLERLPAAWLAASLERALARSQERLSGALREGLSEELWGKRSATWPEMAMRNCEVTADVNRSRCFR